MPKPIKARILKSEKINLLLIQIRIWGPHWFGHIITANTGSIRKKKKLVNYYPYQNTVMRIIKQNFKYFPPLKKRPFHTTKKEVKIQQFLGEVDCGEKLSV